MTRMTTPSGYTVTRETALERTSNQGEKESYIVSDIDHAAIARPLFLMCFSRCKQGLLKDPFSVRRSLFLLLGCIGEADESRRDPSIPSLYFLYIF